MPVPLPPYLASMQFGLLGYPLRHSFSSAYFTTKFKSLGLEGFSYRLIELPDLGGLQQILQSDFLGLNVTKPYKSLLCSYVNQIDKTAWQIGAVNTLVRTGANSWKGFNTDIAGFRDSLQEWLKYQPNPRRALILGTGGAARAVRYVLDEIGIQSAIASRGSDAEYTYATLTPDVINKHLLIINATPLGTFPDIGFAPPIPYEAITSEHMLYDLVYNPANTLFLTRGQEKGARIKNGLDMLHRQADHAWTIWKSYGNF